MRKSRFAEAQIMSILRQVEGGLALADVCREHGTSSATFYKWRSKYGGMDASMIADMKVMEDENRRLKKMFAELSMQKELLKEALGKNRSASSYPASECLHSPKGRAS
jgi:putative transposase